MNTVLRSASVLALFAAALAASAQTAYYGGSPDSSHYLLSQHGGGFTSDVLDDFTLSTATSVTGVFGNFAILDSRALSGFAGLHYEIRQGVVAGGAGTLLFSGDVAATPVANGVTGRGDIAYLVAAPLSGISLAPGTYFLDLAANLNLSPTPMVAGTYLVDSSGSGALGAAGSANSYFNAPANGYAYSHTGSAPGYAPSSDFTYSIGLNGVANPTPEPSALAALGLGAFAFVKRRKRA